MIYKKMLIAAICATLLCIGGVAQAAPQGVDPAKLAEAAKNCPALQGVDMKTLAEAINKCPAFQGMDEAAFVAAIQSCPGLNGQLPPGAAGCPALNGQIDPQALADLAAKCPALNGKLSPEARKCPALNGDLAAAAQNCPALNGSMGPTDQKLAKRAEKRMQRVVKALERNKRSADALIQAAKEAGADPNLIADLEKMSQAFRQLFMQTVSPNQIIESIFSQPRPVQPEGPSGLVITAPDGTQWLVSPDNLPKPPRRGGFNGPQGPIPQQGPEMIAPGMPAGPQGMPPRGLPPQGMKAPKGMPPAAGQPAQQIAQPGQQGPQAEMLIIEEAGPAYMPLWPTKDDLGKDGVLNYLQKRQQAINSAQ